MEEKKVFMHHAAIIVANLIWACNYPLYKIIMPRYIDPIAMVTMAVATAALLALFFSLFSAREKMDKEDIWKMVGAAFLVAIMRKVALMEGLALTSPVDGAIIDAVGPVIVLIIGVIKGSDHFTRRKSAGMALGLVGTVAVILFGSSDAHSHSDLWGNILVFSCAVTSAFYLVWFKTLVRKYRPLTLLRWIYCLGTLMLLPIGFKTTVHTDFAAFPHEVWLVFAFVLIVPTFGPNLLLAWGLKSVHPTVGSIYGYIQPIVGTLLSVLMGLDKVKWDTYLFAAVIFVGVGLVVSSYNKQKKDIVPELHRMKH